VTSKLVSGNENASIIAERTRVAAIVESPEGLARPSAARQLALRSSMDAEAAVEFLRTIPADNPYIAAMEKEGAVGISAAAPGASGSFLSDPKASRLAEIKGSMAAFNETAGYRKES
jgi:hypothetical protein